MSHQHRLSILATALLALLVGACSTSNSVALPANGLLPNMLVWAEGDVKVRRQASAASVRVGFGSELNPGDIVTVVGVDAAVFCGDEEEWDTSPKSLLVGSNRGVPCVRGHPETPEADVGTLRLRGMLDGQLTGVPYALSPRAGFVLDDHPTLRWQGINGPVVYTITLQSNDHLQRPTVAVVGTELPYPSAWPALQAGGDYRLIVETGTTSIADMAANEEGFTLLAGESAARLRSLDARLQERKQELSEAGLALLRAELYLNHDQRFPLHSEAAEILRGVAGGDQIPAIQKLLGKIYLEMGLFTEAERALQQALQQAKAAGLPEFEADAEFGLGMVACLRANKAQAVAHWQVAQDKYSKSGLVEHAQKAAAMVDTAQVECTPSSP